MEHNIPFGNSNRENRTTFLDFPLFLGIFQGDEPTKRVPFTAEPEIPEFLTKWKVPKLSELQISLVGELTSAITLILMRREGNSHSVETSETDSGHGSLVG